MSALTSFSKIKSNLRHVYDDLAEYWGKDFSLHDWGRVELKEFANKVKKNGGRKVLDLGCGSGIQSQQLFGEGLAVVGLDLSPKMVKEAQKRVPQAEFVIGDMINMFFAKESFDGVYARASLLHIPKKLIPKVLKSINKILKNGGILYLAVKEGEDEGEVVDERHGREVKRFFSFFREPEVLDLLDEAGFEISKKSRSQRTKNSTMWLQFFAKKV